MNDKTRQEKHYTATPSGNLRKGKPVQVYFDEGLKLDFERVIRDYDEDLGVAGAIRKLVSHAVKDHWIPGYIRKDKILGRGEPMGEIDGKKALTSKPIRGIINT